MAFEFKSMSSAPTSELACHPQQLMLLHKWWSSILLLLRVCKYIVYNGLSIRIHFQCNSSSSQKSSMVLHSPKAQETRGALL